MHDGEAGKVRPTKKNISRALIDHSYNQKCGLYCIELVLEVKVDKERWSDGAMERPHYHYYTTGCDDYNSLQKCGLSRNVTQRNVTLNWV